MLIRKIKEINNLQDKLKNNDKMDKEQYVINDIGIFTTRWAVSAKFPRRGTLDVLDK